MNVKSASEQQTLRPRDAVHQDALKVTASTQTVTSVQFHGQSCQSSEDFGQAFLEPDLIAGKTSNREACHGGGTRCSRAPTWPTSPRPTTPLLRLPRRS